MSTETTNREERFIAKLIKDTNKGDLKWVIDSSRITLPGNERLSGKIYLTDIDGQSIRLYSYNVKYYKDEDEWEWIESLRLELIDKGKETLYEFKYGYAFDKLINAVRKSTSDVDNFMKGFLNE